jgi:hypothetical protein
MKYKAKYRFHAAAMSFYILQKTAHVLHCSNICWDTLFVDPVLNGASGAHTSQAIINCRWDNLQWHNVIKV